MLSRPRTDNTIEVNPLKWDWLCLDNVLYHGHNLTIIWDKNGDKYHLGKGLRVLVDGKEVGKADKLTRILYPYYIKPQRKLCIFLTFKSGGTCCGVVCFLSNVGKEPQDEP